MSMEPPPETADRERPFPGRPPDAEEAADLARLFRLLCDPTRLEILKFLAGREHSVSEIVAEFPGVEDQLISRHLGILRRGGLVGDRKHGRFRIYELTDLGRAVARLIGQLPSA